MKECAMPITVEQFKKYSMANGADIHDFVLSIANKSPFPPAGYGFSNPRILAINGDYFAKWERYESCD